MIVFACKNCKYTDLSDDTSDYICPRCGGSMTSLGVDSAAWNDMSQEQMQARVDGVYEPSLTETVDTDAAAETDEIPPVSPDFAPDHASVRKPDRIKKSTSSDKPHRPVRPGFIIAAAAALFVLASFVMWNNIRGLIKSTDIYFAEPDEQVREIPEPEDVSKKSEASD